MELLLVALLAGLTVCHCAVDDESAGAKYLEIVNNELNNRDKAVMRAMWAFMTNKTDENESNMDEVSTSYGEYLKEASEGIQNFNWRSYSSPDVRRQFKKLSKTIYEELLQNEAKDKDSNIAAVRVCDYKNVTKCDLSLETEIEEAMSTSLDPEELKHYWTQFYDKAGTPIRTSFERYIELTTKEAKRNNFSSVAELLLDEHEDETFEAQLEAVFEDIKPFFEQFHAYVRYHLRKVYGAEVVSEEGPLPIHLLGNMWADKWNIADIVLPFPNNIAVDVSEEMVAQGYTSLKMFQMADEFFQSMGLTELPQNFWNKSIFELPDDGRDMECHPYSWYFSADDVRISTCAQVNIYHFVNIHNYVGIIQYLRQLQSQPFLLRDNSVFQNAVSRLFLLSTSTIKHVESVGLLKNYKSDNETRVSALFINALETIVPLLNIFTLNKYRWALLRGQVEKSKWNCAFWKLREEYLGIEPPVVRNEENYDAPAQNDDIAELLSTIIGFQLYKSACIKAGQYDSSNPALPLDNCDIEGSLQAGNDFKKLSSLGNSKPLADLLEAFTGERTLDGKAIAEYFEPFRVWLHDENAKNEAHVGWTRSDKCISA